MLKVNGLPFKANLRCRTKRSIVVIGHGQGISLFTVDIFGSFLYKTRVNFKSAVTLRDSNESRRLI